MTRDGEWVTQVEAAALLGVHKSLIAKMVRRGDLRPRPDQPSLSRREVLELAEQRAKAAQAVEEARRAREAPRPPRGPTPRPVARPPDQIHEWVPVEHAATMLGLSPSGVNYRAQRDQLPHTWSDRRRWFRLDHLELVLRAEAARRTMLG